MTFGRWLQTAAEALSAAAGSTSAHPTASRRDAVALRVARRRCYTGLARLTELLLGGQPVRVEVSRDEAELILEGPRPATTRLYLGLRVAAGDALPNLTSRPTGTTLAAHLSTAADALAVAGDVIGRHLPRRRRPRTPEGVAIRAGAGRAQALADIARLTHLLLAVDARLPTWIRHRSSHRRADMQAYQPVSEAARWSTGSGLAMAADHVIAQADSQPSLLRLLDIAQLPGAVLRANASTTSALGLLVGCRNWMYRNPDQIRAAHLAVGTRLGHVITLLAKHDHPPPGATVQPWRQAADRAAELYGSPPTGESAAIVEDLQHLTEWIHRHSQLEFHPVRRARRLAELTRLAADLPTLATVLLTGAKAATARGELWVSEPYFVKSDSAMIYNATTTWRAARRDDLEVRELCRMLRVATTGTATGPVDNLPARNPAAIAKQAFPTMPPITGQQSSGNLSATPVSKRPRRR